MTELASPPAHDFVTFGPSRCDKLRSVLAAITQPTSARAASYALMRVATVVPGVLLPDDTLPTITMLFGDYPMQPFVTTTGGGSGIVTNVTVGMDYVDPGEEGEGEPLQERRRDAGCSQRFL